MWSWCAVILEVGVCFVFCCCVCLCCVACSLLLRVCCCVLRLNDIWCGGVSAVLFVICVCAHVSFFLCVCVHVR